MKPLKVLILICAVMQSCTTGVKIEKVADLTFRNSFADHLEMSDRELDSIEKLDPSLLTQTYGSTEIINALEKKGLLKNGKLQLAKINGFETSQDFKTAKRKEYNFCKVFYDEKAESRILEIKCNGHISKFKIESENMVLRYKADDLISGGFKEIIVLEPYYIMNGDNYNLRVYKIINGS